MGAARVGGRRDMLLKVQTGTECRPYDSCVIFTEFLLSIKLLHCSWLHPPCRLQTTKYSNPSLVVAGSKILTTPPSYPHPQLPFSVLASVFPWGYSIQHLPCSGSPRWPSATRISARSQREVAVGGDDSREPRGRNRDCCRSAAVERRGLFWADLSPAHFLLN